MSRPRSGPNAWVLAFGLVLLVPFVVLFVRSFGNNPNAVPFLLEGKPAPAFALEDLDGNAMSMDDLVGKPVVINFWSTWCQPCKQEHPLLTRAPTTYPDVTWLGVIYQDDANKARAYLQRAGAGFPHLIDPGGSTAVRYGVAGVPETYFIGRSGNIIYKQVGPLNATRLEQLVTAIRSAS